MMKFFRKYNKQLLAIFMALLMIVFIGGSALEALIRPDINPVIATTRYGEILFKDREMARATTELLSSLGIPWEYPAGARKPIDVMDWLLLLKEAQGLGATITPVAARSSSAGEKMNDLIDRVARNRRIRPDVLYNALAQLMTIEQAASGAVGVNAPSDAELSIAARNALETVEMDAVVLPAKPFIDQSQTFSRDETEQQLAKYKDREKGPGLNFGYFQGTALKAQYIQIDRDAIAKAISISDLDKKARKLYDERRESEPLFRRTEMDPLPPDPFRDGQLAGPPLPPPPYKQWDQARQIAVDIIRKQEADELAQRIANWLLQYSSEAFADVERNPAGYRPAPAEVAQLDYYSRLVEHPPQSLQVPGAISIAATIFFTEKQAEAIQPIATAVYRSEQGLPRRFKDLAFRCEPSVPKVPTGEGVNVNDYISLWQTSQYPLVDPATGNVFVFRIVDFKPPHAPQSVDEVHDQILEDLRLIRAMEVARKHAAELVNAVQSGATLKQAFEARQELVDLKSKSTELGFFEPTPFSRVTKGQAARGRPQTGVFVSNGVGSLPNDVVDGIFALQDAPQKVKEFELTDRAAVLVAQWKATRAAPEKEFIELKKTLVTDISRERRNLALADWLDVENIKARTRFEWAR